MDKRGPCTVNLFASLSFPPIYYNWRLDSGAAAVNALCPPWGTSIGCAFPPFCMIGRCLAKITSEKVPRIILITPLWKAWFPLILWMSVEIPLLRTTKPQENINGPTGEQSYHGATGSFSVSYRLCHEFASRSRTFRECYQARLCYMENQYQSIIL